MREFMAGESGSDWPCCQPELLGSSDEQVEGTQTHLGQRNIIEATRHITDFRSFFTNLVAVIKEIMTQIVTLKFKWAYEQ
jgi:hypothetical protein